MALWNSGTRPGPAESAHSRYRCADDHLWSHPLVGESPLCAVTRGHTGGHPSSASVEQGCRGGIRSRGHSRRRPALPATGHGCGGRRDMRAATGCANMVEWLGGEETRRLPLLDRRLRAAPPPPEDGGSRMSEIGIPLSADEHRTNRDPRGGVRPDNRERGDVIGVVPAGAGVRVAREAGLPAELLPILDARGRRPTVFVGAGAVNAALFASPAHLWRARLHRRGRRIRPTRCPTHHQQRTRRPSPARHGVRGMTRGR